MARNGYVNCNSCHISLNGGGILNDYGRKISKEEFAIWKNPDENSKEEEFLYGVLGESPIQKWLKLSGNVRSVYYYVNTDTVEMGKTLLMQADFQTALNQGQWTLVAAGGVTQLVAGTPVEFISRNHYLIYDINDEFHLRAGKFIPAFGILNPEHVHLTKAPLQLGYNFESYNFEGSYISENWNWFLTGIFGRLDDPSLDRDQGFSIQGAYLLSEKVKLGLNSWYGKKKASAKWLFGGFALVGITDQLFASSEVDFKSYQSKETGIASTQKVSYKLQEGLWVYGIQEFGTQKIPTVSDSTTQVYGIGIQFFPRTHFEFNLAYEKTLNRSNFTSRSVSSSMDSVWLVSHFYL